MRRKVPLVSRENTAHRAQILAEIGRGLRERYDAEQPLPGRLANLVREIDQLPECHSNRRDGRFRRSN
jgi:hypothetical protein